ncbi:hypothetical protein B4098_1864 [Heyndrickxia coagulans]|uniref:Uncharacterized protein n=1 Tax=Heyndrickxia coagulans TaxID=1398 RepID=A0A150JYX3_HEYCO|nr:hypothetical protein B4098_1864 [Heyndrickxia coagulans]
MIGIFSDDAGHNCLLIITFKNGLSFVKEEIFLNCGAAAADSHDGDVLQQEKVW